MAVVIGLGRTEVRPPEEGMGERRSPLRKTEQVELRPSDEWGMTIGLKRVEVRLKVFTADKADDMGMGFVRGLLRHCVTRNDTRAYSL